MAVLESYGRAVDSIFQLLGDKENDITLSMSWVLARCPEFLKAIVSEVSGVVPDPEETAIMNQKYDSATGITDIEITDHSMIYMIIEAKRGWILPGADQLTRYSVRKDFVSSGATKKVIVTMSECSTLYADLYLPFREVNGIPIVHLPYADVYRIASSAVASSNNEAKHLLRQFTNYLRGVMTMQKADSNWVYVVALNRDKPEGCSISYIDIVQKKNRYFCPVGQNGWPKDPPNYIAFRYDGKLQSIHHIESYAVTRNTHSEIPEMPDEEWEFDSFVFTLGPAIKPNKEVKTGKIYRSGRVWAMLDTLLTCDTISDARDASKLRL